MHSFFRLYCQIWDCCKKLAAESKNAGFEKASYTFTGIMPEVPYLYLYKFNMETPSKKLQYTILGDVKKRY